MAVELCFMLSRLYILFPLAQIMHIINLIILLPPKEAHSRAFAAANQMSLSCDYPPLLLENQISSGWNVLRANKR